MSLLFLTLAPGSASRCPSHSSSRRAASRQNTRRCPQCYEQREKNESVTTDNKTDSDGAATCFSQLSDEETKASISLVLILRSHHFVANFWSSSLPKIPNQAQETETLRWKNCKNFSAPSRNRLVQEDPLSLLKKEQSILFSFFVYKKNLLAREGRQRLRFTHIPRLN